MAGLIDSTGNAVTPADNTAEITNFYNSYLGRAPDQAGMQGYLDHLNNGGTISDVANSISNSPESKAYMASVLAKQSSLLNGTNTNSTTTPATVATNPVLGGTDTAKTANGTPYTSVVAPQANTPSGLVNTDNLGYNATSATTAAPGTVSGYSPTNWNVTSPQTVSGQVNGLIAQDSPLMQTARTQAAQTANDRGLLNSSMANQSGEQAVINEALPIATADAQTNAQAAQFNAGTATNASAFGAGAQNTQNLQTQQLGTNVNLANANAANTAASTTSAEKLQGNMANATAANSIQLTNVDNAFKASLANADAATRIKLTQLQGATQTNLANIEADYKTLMQTSSTVGSMYQTTAAQIAQYVSDPNMDAESKAAAINGTLGQFRQVASAVGSVNGVNVGDLLNFPTVT